MSNSKNTQVRHESKEERGGSAFRYELIADGADYLPEEPFKGMYVSVSGDIKIKDADGVETVLPGVTAGEHPFGGIGIISAGTTATGLIIIR